MGRHGWDTGPRRWRFTALIGVGMAALALVLTMCTAWPGDDGRGDSAGTSTDGAKVHGTPPPGAGKPEPDLGWGFTHTQFSADAGDDTARARAEKLLAERKLPQIQHLMGWGSNNPEPSPGRYQFGEMDSRIDLIRRSGGVPVVTLCCAPDWMKGGREGAANTDWSKQALETAPSPEHYADFAKLAGVVARRYPDVKHFIVWNEFKGFFDDGARRWNYEGYTKLYNLVYAELKKAGKDILVGGPYLVMDSLEPRATENASSVRGPWGSLDQRSLDAFTYWNENKKGADFAVVDGSSYSKDDELLPSEFGATDKFTAVSRWVRQQTGGKLPLWWAEYYVEPGDAQDERDGWSEAHRAAVHAAGMIALVRGGAGTAFYWNPQKEGAKCAGCLWTPTQLADGGAELPMMKLISRFAGEFPPGTRYDDGVQVAADDAPNIRVLADEKTVLVVNTLDRALRAEVDGRAFDMNPYEVRWLTRG